MWTVPSQYALPVALKMFEDRWLVEGEHEFGGLYGGVCEVYGGDEVV